MIDLKHVVGSHTVAKTQNQIQKQKSTSLNNSSLKSIDTFHSSKQKEKKNVGLGAWKVGGHIFSNDVVELACKYIPEKFKKLNLSAHIDSLGNFDYPNPNGYSKEKIKNLKINDYLKANELIHNDASLKKIEHTMLDEKNGEFTSPNVFNELSIKKFNAEEDHSADKYHGSSIEDDSSSSDTDLMFYFSDLFNY